MLRIETPDKSIKAIIFNSRLRDEPSFQKVRVPISPRISGAFSDRRYYFLYHEYGTFFIRTFVTSCDVMSNVATG